MSRVGVLRASPTEFASVYPASLQPRQAMLRRQQPSYGEGQYPPRWLEAPNKQLSAGDLYLNFSMPDFDKVVRPNMEVRLRVNLDSQPRSPEGHRRDSEGSLDSLDVLLSCRQAVVLPSRRQRLYLPLPTDMVEFRLVPKQSGRLKVEVFILDRNEPIYETEISINIEKSV